jgi:hypothetical protein
MKNKIRQKTVKFREVAEKSLSFLEKNHSKFLLVFTIIVTANVLGIVLFGAKSSVLGLVSVSGEYLEAKIRNENVNHFVATKKVVKSAQANIEYIETELGWPSNDAWLSGEKRLELLTKLRRLDEVSYELEWVANKYFADHSIQYYPYSTGNLSSYFYETRYLKKAIDRFVRVAEFAIAFDSFGERQVETIEVELQEMKEYLANIEQFEKDLQLLR